MRVLLLVVILLTVAEAKGRRDLLIGMEYASANRWADCQLANGFDTVKTVANADGVPILQATTDKYRNIRGYVKWFWPPDGSGCLKVKRFGEVTPGENKPRSILHFRRNGWHEWYSREGQMVAKILYVNNNAIERGWFVSGDTLCQISFADSGKVDRKACAVGEAAPFAEQVGNQCSEYGVASDGEVFAPRVQLYNGKAARDWMTFGCSRSRKPAEFSTGGWKDQYLRYDPVF
jgi:hypothetical protein